MSHPQRSKRSERSRRTLVSVAFAAVAVALAACQGGGFDSGTGGMPGEMGPPVGNPGPMGVPTGEMQGPTTGPNGQPELTVPGATLAPNESQYPVGDGPSGMKCPQVSIQIQQFNCSISFNVPPPSPSPSPDGSSNPKAKATPKPTPSPSPSPTPSCDENDDNCPSPSPTPPGTITLQMEPLPKDIPPMTNPDPRALHVTPLVAIRLQSDTDFALNGWASVGYSLPRQQMMGRGFAIQLYNEGMIQRKRADAFLATYNKYTATDTSLQFAFPTPKITVKRGQIWLLALYGLTYPPNSTPTPSPSPSPAASGSAAPTTAPFLPPSTSPSP